MEDTKLNEVWSVTDELNNPDATLEEIAKLRERVDIVYEDFSGVAVQWALHFDAPVYDNSQVEHFINALCDNNVNRELHIHGCKHRIVAVTDYILHRMDRATYCTVYTVNCDAEQSLAPLTLLAWPSKALERSMSLLHPPQSKRDVSGAESRLRPAIMVYPDWVNVPVHIEGHPVTINLTKTEGQ